MKKQQLSMTQLIKMGENCVMKMHIGQEIRKKVDESGITISSFANMIQRERSTVYNIFTRSNIDTELLEVISIALKYNFFKLYVPMVNNQLGYEAGEPKIEYITMPDERKMMVEMTESEYDKAKQHKIL